jgi:hypothetical protein
LAPRAKFAKCFLLTINLKQKIMLAHVHIRRQGDEEQIKDRYDSLMKLNDEEFLEKFNYYKKQPFFGVHDQALFFIALSRAAKQRQLDFGLKIDPHGIMEFEEERKVTTSKKSSKKNG